MELSFVGHACVVLRSSAGASLVLDPWLHEPVFASRWYRYPPQDLAAVPRSPEVLALSHAHPDHASVATLKALTPGRVVMCRFETGFLRRRVQKRFASGVLELEPWLTQDLGPARITAIPNDLGWEDASLVVEVDGVRVYHGNDNPLRRETYARVREVCGPIDLALLPFAGASSFPTCFDWPAEAVARAAQAKKDEALDRFRDGVSGLQPRVAAPFASHWALLDTAFLERNWSDRYTVDEAIAKTRGEFPQTELLPVAPGDAWSPRAGYVRGPEHDRWPQSHAALRRYAETVARELQRVDEVPTELHYERLAELLRALAVKVRLAVPAVICVEATGGEVFCLRFRAGETTLERLPRLPADWDEVVRVAPADVVRLARGHNRWEDLWYGYALRVSKREGTPYFRAFWEALLEYDAPGFEAIGE